MLLTATTEPFALYHFTWAAYLAAGCILLFMIWYKVKHWGFWGKTILLSFFAAGTFSFNGVPNADTFAPSAISFILELENEGMDGEIKILTYLVVSWIVFILLTVAARQIRQALGKSNDDSVSKMAAKLAEAKQQQAASNQQKKSIRTEPSINE